MGVPTGTVCGGDHLCRLSSVCVQELKRYCNSSSIFVCAISDREKKSPATIIQVGFNPLMHVST